uniref:Uncharacterized protein n=1 Tax=Aegilops tauschii subsp. strangulata TaxID=200361 RepID=A0A452ZNN9_AEGTS
MQYTGPTYRFPPTVPEMLYSAGVYVESTLHVWAMSRWRGTRGVTDFFLGAGYGHLPRGSPRMYRVEEVIHNGVVVAILCPLHQPLRRVLPPRPRVLVWLRVHSFYHP